MYSHAISARLDRSQYLQLTRSVGRQCHIDDKVTSQNSGIFNGQFNLLKLRNGLTLHTADGYDMGDFKTQVTLQPRIGFMLFLKGQCDIHYGDRTVSLGAMHKQQKSLIPEATLISLAEPEIFVRQAKQGRYLKKVVVGINSEWFDAGGLDGVEDYQQIIKFSQQHLNVKRYLISQQMQFIAEKMFTPPNYSPFLQKLYLEGLTLELSSEVLSLLTKQPILTAQSKLQPYEIKRVNKVLELLQSTTDSEVISLDSIAQELGTNVNSLQRNFRTMMGTTIFEYYRSQKLMEARTALENNHMNVLEAALQAGYNSPANFSTAFKRLFGVTPNQVRGRIY